MLDEERRDRHPEPARARDVEAEALGHRQRLGAAGALVEVRHRLHPRGLQRVDADALGAGCGRPATGRREVEGARRRERHRADPRQTLDVGSAPCSTCCAPVSCDGLTICVVGDGAAERELGAAGARRARGDGRTATWPTRRPSASRSGPRLGRIDVLVVDAASVFAAAGGGMAGLRSAVDDGWNVGACGGQRVGGRVEAGRGARRRQGRLPRAGRRRRRARHAVGAALENAARTLSVEWARFGVRITAVRPREGVGDERAELVAFLASPAGRLLHGVSFYPRGVRAIIAAQLLLPRLAEVSMQLAGHPPHHGDHRRRPAQPRLLHAGPRPAAGRQDRQPGRPDRLPPVLRRRAGAAPARR